MELMDAYAETILEGDQNVLRYLFEQKMSIRPEIARKHLGLASGFNLSMAIRCAEDDLIRRCYARTLTHNREPIYAAGFDPTWKFLQPQARYRMEETIEMDLVFEELEDARYFSKCNKIIDVISESFYAVGCIRSSQSGLLDAGHPVIKIELLIMESEWKV